MDNQFENEERKISSFSRLRQISKGLYVKSLAVLGGLIAFVFAGYLCWGAYIDSVDTGEIEWQTEQVKKYDKANSDLASKMEADTYGGKTPQETLDLFVAALEKEDIDLATKYFALETNELDSNYLAREKWTAYLLSVKERGYLETMANDIKTGAQPVEDSSVGTVGFELLDEDGVVQILIIMRLNQYSNIWKIQSI